MNGSVSCELLGPQLGTARLTQPSQEPANYSKTSGLCCWSVSIRGLVGQRFCCPLTDWWKGFRTGR
jgi:hypothetical protein